MSQATMAPPLPTSVEHLERVIADVEYLPGWEFTVGGGGYDHPRVHLRFENDDSHTGERRTFNWVAEFPPMPGGWTDQLIALVLWRLVLRAHRHEAGEFFRWCGQRIADPHMSTLTDDYRPIDARTALAL